MTSGRMISRYPPRTLQRSSHVCTTELLMAAEPVSEITRSSRSRPGLRITTENDDLFVGRDAEVTRALEAISGGAKLVWIRARRARARPSC